MRGLEGRRALVTGGARGIGRACVLALAKAGVRTVVAYRTKDQAVVDLDVELAEIGSGHRLVQADVTSAEDVAALAKQCEDFLGGLDIVVNNAGVISHVPYSVLSDDEWDRIVRTNLDGTHRVTKAVLPLLGNGSSVVNIGSGTADAGVPTLGHYAARRRVWSG